MNEFTKMTKTKEYKYIHSFNFDGGGSCSRNKKGRYHVDYIYNESKLTVLFINLRLYLIYMRQRDSKFVKRIKRIARRMRV